MHDLASMTPLGASAPLSETIGSVTIREVTDLTFASVEARAGGGKNLAKSAKTLLGSAPPGPGRSSKGRAIGACWIGPEKWLFLAPSESHENLASELREKFGKSASVTEQSDGWACFSIEGEDLNELLLRLIPIDVNDLTQDTARRTMIEHVAIILLCDNPGKAIRIFCARSYAEHLYHALAMTVRSVRD